MPYAKGENERVANMTENSANHSALRCGECTRGDSVKDCGIKRPCTCYLAISTVPMQNADWNRVYGLDEALMRGTLFPELCLPFIGSGR